MTDFLECSLSEQDDPATAVTTAIKPSTTGEGSDSGGGSVCATTPCGSVNSAATPAKELSHGQDSQTVLEDVLPEPGNDVTKCLNVINTDLLVHQVSLDSTITANFKTDFEQRYKSRKKFLPEGSSADEVPTDGAEAACMSPTDGSVQDGADSTGGGWVQYTREGKLRKRPKYRVYTQAALQEAIKLVMVDKMPQRLVCDTYKIPRTTLHDHILREMKEGFKKQQKQATNAVASEGGAEGLDGHLPVAAESLSTCNTAYQIHTQCDDASTYTGNGMVG